MEGTYKKSKGNAGLEGVQFQLDLLIVFLLNAVQNLKNWRISSENQNAGKYDDLVLELPDKDVFLQAKFKQTKKINRDQLFSNNSKNADFSLPKYFFSYLEIKSEVKEKIVVICTNTDIERKDLKNALISHHAGTDNLLHYGQASCTCTFFTFNQNILHDLKENVQSYLEKNLQSKGIDGTLVTEDNLINFLDNLQFFCNYPSGDELHKIIEQLLSRLSDSPLWCKTSYHEIYRKIEDWFKQPKGEYLTELRTNAIICEIRSDKYCELLKDYNVSFEHNDLNFNNSNRIFHVEAKEGHLLHMLKIFYALQADKSRKLYVDPDDDAEVQKYVTEAFGLRQYVFLIMIWSKIGSSTLRMEIICKLKEILEKDKYKKVILVGESNIEVVQEIDMKDICPVNDFVAFNDLSKNSQKRLLRKRNVLFQGEKTSLEEFLDAPLIEDLTKSLNSGMLEKLVRTEEITVGKRLSDLDAETTYCYIQRTFERDNSEPGKKEDPIPEEYLFNMNERVVLISNSAGMGKTTILTKLAAYIKEKNCLKWVIRINLGDYTKILKEFLKKNRSNISLKELLNSQEATKLTNQLEELVFSINGKVILLMDALDEISPNYTDLILHLLKQCETAVNIVKIFITARIHMTQELRKANLKFESFKMLPFTRQNQIDFLTKYWMHNLHIQDANEKKRKFEQYAEMLIAKMYLWIQSYAYREDSIIGIPLQVRMLAEIFQEKTTLETTDWECCKDYLSEDHEVPKLPDKFDLTELYDMFIEKKREVFIDKGNPTGNTAAEQALWEQFENYLAYHRSLALKVILTEDQRNLFSDYREGNLNYVLKIGIVQGRDENLFFIHRTFSEYFVAACLLQELQQNPSVEFQRFLIDEVLVKNEFKVICVFFDMSLRKVIDSLPSDLFKKYQCDISESNLNLIFKLAKEGYLAVLQLILKCINFKVISGKQIDIKNFQFPSESKRNTLNDLEMVMREAGVNIRNENGQTPLMSAIDGGHFEMVKFLIQQGADVNIEDRIRRRPLHYAANNGKLAIVKHILEVGVDVNARDSEGCTPLYTATSCGNCDVVNYLIEFGADINIEDCYGNPVLHKVAENGDTSNIDCLLERGVGVNDRDRKGRTPLFLAAYCKRLDMVKYLVKLGSDINIKDNDNCTVLHWAAVGNDLNTVKYLVECGLDVNDRYDRGQTPLHLAATYGDLSVVEYLVTHGADVNIKDNDDLKPLDLANSQGRWNIVKYLKECTTDIGTVDCGISSN